MSYAYVSSWYDEAGTSTCEGSIDILRSTEPCEASVNVWGHCYHLIFGHYDHGRFLCIPNWDVGMSMGHPADRFWNYEKLVINGLSEVDASGIADALVKLNELIY